MTIRRSLVASVVVVAFLATILASQHTRATTLTSFGSVPYASRPYASHRTPITTTWYCPGVPAADTTVGGQLVIANPTDVPINGRVTFVGSDGAAPVIEPIVAPPRDQLSIDVGKVLTATFVSSIVELDGGEGLVEQRALFPAGNAVASCTTQTSPKWYFADGWTKDGSTDQLVITNPYEDTVSVDITFFTKDGPRKPGAFQGDSIEPKSIKVINVQENGLQDESIIGVQVVASRGRLIVARAQHYQGGGRLGYTLSLGAPAPSEQLWFAEGDHQGSDVTEQYVIFNPTDEDTDVTVTVLGIPQVDGFVPPNSVPVPAGSIVTFDTASVTGLPDGPHSIVFATPDGKPAMVIERVLTQKSGGGPVTSVVLGMTPEYVVPRWYLPIGVDEADDDGIVVYNPYQAAATVALKEIGPGGEVAVPGMDAIPLPGAGIITIPLTDTSVFGKVLVVEASAGVFVERRLPRGNGLSGRSGLWALPECGPCSFSSPPSS